MSTLAVLHISFIVAWAAIIAVESIIEFFNDIRTSDQAKMVADLHFKIDVYLEVPVVLGVLVTGALLLSDATWSILLAIKVAGALFAIGMNALCVVIVIRRHAALRDAVVEGVAESFTVRSNRIFDLASVGIPVGIAAFVLGWVLY